jgi:hypothetical protein
LTGKGAAQNAARLPVDTNSIQGANDAKTYARPMPANARAILIEAFRNAHHWLDEFLSDPRLTLESIASREDKSDRSIRRTLSLAFLAPEIVKAAVEGRLPRGFGLKRLVDLPMARRDQWPALGSRRQHRPKGRIRPCSFVFPRRTDPSIPNRVKTRSSSPQGPFEIGRGGHVANSSLGNGNLRPETFGETRRELAHVGVEESAETDSGAASYGNVVLSCGVGNHVVLRGLPGGGRSPGKPVSGVLIPC